jgi:hypothetical protein
MKHLTMLIPLLTTDIILVIQYLLSAEFQELVLAGNYEAN